MDQTYICPLTSTVDPNPQFNGVRLDPRRRTVVSACPWYVSFAQRTCKIVVGVQKKKTWGRKTRVWKILPCDNVHRQHWHCGV